MIPSSPAPADDTRSGSRQDPPSPAGAASPRGAPGPQDAVDEWERRLERMGEGPPGTWSPVKR